MSGVFGLVDFKTRGWRLDWWGQRVTSLFAWNALNGGFFRSCRLFFFCLAFWFYSWGSYTIEQLLFEVMPPGRK
ncbi:hypothetical protein V8C44DRAFT_321292 [Trichoderma aethiopicum]